MHQVYRENLNILVILPPQEEYVAQAVLRYYELTVMYVSFL